MSWRALPPPPFPPRGAATVVSCSRGIVVWGGGDDTPDYTANYHGDGALFDPEAETWTMIPPAPLLPAYTPGIAVPAGVVFFGGSEVTIERTFEFEPEGRPWVRKSETPRALLLKTDSLTWRELPPCPFDPRNCFYVGNYPTAFAAGDVVYWWGLRGDRTWGWTDSPLVALDVATETWTLPEAQTQARKRAVAVATPAGLAVWGGYRQEGELAHEGELFDPKDRTWRPMAPSPIGIRFDSTGCVASSTLYVLGGETNPDGSARPNARVERVAHCDGAAYDLDRDAWTPIAPAPVPPSGCTAWTGSQVLVTTGGRTLMYDPVTDTWERHATGVPGPVVSWGGRVYGSTNGAEIWGDAQLAVWEPGGVPAPSPPAQPTVTVAVAPGTLERLTATTGAMRFELRDAADAEAATAAMAEARRRVLAIRHPEEPDEAFASYAGAVEERDGVIGFVVDMADAEAYDGVVEAALDAVTGALRDAGVESGALSAG